MDEQQDVDCAKRPVMGIHQTNVAEPTHLLVYELVPPDAIGHLHLPRTNPPDFASRGPPLG